MTKITILTLFPEFFTSFLDNSIIKRAVAKKAVDFKLVNIREFSKDKHHRVDDRPLGGGAGLIMKLQPLCDALNSIRTPSSHIILTSPYGYKYDQKKAIELSKKEDIVIVCGHYEGIDYRFNKYCDELISIGDYILTGGEIAALAISDSVTRLLKGAISEESIESESFDNSLLEYPQYTYPIEYNGDKVPDILLTGDHQAVNNFRLRKQLELTKNLRPDLFNKKEFSKEELKRLKELETKEISKREKQALIKGERFIKKD